MRSAVRTLPRRLLWPQRPISRARATMTSATAEYQELAATLRELDALEGIKGLLGWDEMTMMPQGAAGSRAAQKAALAGVLHDRRTNARIGQLTAALSGVELNEWEAATVREAARQFKKESSLSKELAQRKGMLDSEGYQAWVAAREAKDWSLFAPKLQEWLNLTREMCAAVDPSKPAYDVALDDYEKGMTSERLDAVFAELKAGIIPLIQELKGGTAPDASWLRGDWDVKKQSELCDTIAKEMGFNTERGRLDVSVHPFTGGAHPTDVRMTTRFKADDMTEGLTGAIHETGHALYEQGRNLEYDGLPVNQALSMGVHESQSLIWERMVALSPAFAEYLLPRIQERFPEFGQGKTPQDLYAALNVVRDPSLIRVESDEVTYALHIVLRYELETALLKGDLAVDDVPRVWNERMQHYLGCTPEDDAQGCLQDVHWSFGAIGYFPTYSLGALAASQLYHAANEALPDFQEHVRTGDFKPILQWLREKVHVLGSLPKSADELMERATGQPLNVGLYLDYLRNKYHTLYKL